MTDRGERLISLAALCRELGRVQESELQRWVTAEWVRPAARQPEPRFGAIDVARVRLIVELRDEMEVGEAAMPVVLSLLDQLYEARRQMRLLCARLEDQGYRVEERPEALPLDSAGGSAPRPA